MLWTVCLLALLLARLFAFLPAIACYSAATAAAAVDALLLLLSMLLPAFPYVASAF